MTAHPESPVGRLRALEANDASHSALLRLERACTDATPALLAALEKVWDACEPEDYDRAEPHDRARVAAANGVRMQHRTILAHLFEKPENPT